MNSQPRPPFHIAFWRLLRSYMPSFKVRQSAWLRRLLPTPGNVIFTLLLVGGLFWAGTAGAVPLLQGGELISTIPYQGRLADADGAPLTGTYSIAFRLYSAATGGAPLWEEQWTGSNGVQVSDGLFNVMLGSLTPVPQSVITGNSNLWLGVTVGTDDEMTPRVQIGTLPFAVQALTVPDGAITTEKLDDGSVTSDKWNPTSGIIHSPGDIALPAATNQFIDLASTPVTINLEKPAILTAYLTADIAVGPNTTAAAVLWVNNTSAGSGAILGSDSSGGIRASVAQQYRQVLPAGSYTLQIRGVRISGSSSATVMGHTYLTYVVQSQ